MPMTLSGRARRPRQVILGRLDRRAGGRSYRRQHPCYRCMRAEDAASAACCVPGRVELGEDERAGRCGGSRYERKAVASDSSDAARREMLCQPKRKQWRERKTQTWHKALMLWFTWMQRRGRRHHSRALYRAARRGGDVWECWDGDVVRTHLPKGLWLQQRGS